MPLLLKNLHFLLSYDFSCHHLSRMFNESPCKNKNIIYINNAIKYDFKQLEFHWCCEFQCIKFINILFIFVTFFFDKYLSKYLYFTVHGWKWMLPWSASRWALSCKYKMKICKRGFRITRIKLAFRKCKYVFLSIVLYRAQCLILMFFK